jgi:hypothetical protein
VGVGGSVGEEMGSGRDGVEVTGEETGVSLSVGTGLAVIVSRTGASVFSSAALSTGIMLSPRAQARPVRNKEITAKTSFTCRFKITTIKEPLVRNLIV